MNISSIVSLPVSVGEAIDKWNILHIKKDYVKDEFRLGFIQQEIETLRADLEPLLGKPGMSQLYQYLDYFNRKIWTLCDLLRVADVNTYDTFDKVYAKNCVDVIKYNDARFRVKNQMNLVVISSLREQKNFAGTKIFIWFPQDMIYHKNMVGLVRYFSFCYDKVLLSVDKEYIDQVALFYKNNVNIEFQSEMNNVNRVISSSSSPEVFYQECGLDYHTIQTIFGK